MQNVVIIPASASTLIPIPPEEIGNRQGVNENSPPRGEIKVRKNEMKLRKNEIKVPKNLPFAPWQIKNSSEEILHFLEAGFAVPSSLFAIN